MNSVCKLSLRGFDDSIRAAYARMFPSDPDKSPDMLEWRFQRNPHGQAKFAVAEDGGKVVGMIALVPTELLSAGATITAYQAIDTMVDAAYRGQSLFVRLGTLAQDSDQLGGQILWGLPNANAAPGWYGRLGWTNFGPVPMLIRPLRSGFVLGRMHRALRAVDLPLIGRHRGSFDGIHDFRDEFDQLWSETAPGLSTTVDRSARWMRWRLFEKPRADYRVTASRVRSQLNAIVISRISDKHGERLCYLMDALVRPADAAMLPDLIRSELARAAEAGAGAALAWCPPHAPNYKAYRRAGFIPFPPRLRPIEINFGARSLEPEAKTAVAAPWTISLLDSDTN